MSELVPVRRALLSVSDKTGLVEFASALHREFAVELLSTGGTAGALRDAGLPVTDVSQVTGFPEMMDGRVKTLHPLIHGALLALRDHPEHLAAMRAHGIQPIDLLCVNLYPFTQTISRPDCTFEQAIENIDIGGPALIRAAAKNHRWVLVVTSPERYDKVLGDLREHAGACCGKHRLKQARLAFAHTAEYDRAIAEYLADRLDSPDQPAGDELPERFTLHLCRRRMLRYGENPHQRAALYVAGADAPDSLAGAEQLHGKELSYINLLDADAAMRCVAEFDQPAACIVKHATPCGVAIGAGVADAFEKAHAGDPVAAFGGVVAVNGAIDLRAAEAIVAGQKFLEVIVAPDYAPDALELIRSRWKNVRLLRCAAASRPGPPARTATPARGLAGSAEVRTISGGYLVQQRDALGLNESDWKVVSARPPTQQELSDLRIAWLICKHVKSNAIVLCKNGASVGIGGGQVDRVGAARIAVEKAGTRAATSVAASDAFFPFPDGPAVLLASGVTAIIQPGGSVRDAETIAAVNAAGAAMVFTGTRHFRH